MIEREVLAKCLEYLAPGAIFSFWAEGAQDYIDKKLVSKTRSFIKIVDGQEVIENENYFEEISVPATRDMGNDMPLIHMDGWVINWRKNNKIDCPTLDQIKAVDINLVEESIKKVEKQARNSIKITDLSLFACFMLSKKDSPDLEFSDYLDQLEAQATDYQDKMKQQGLILTNPEIKNV